MGCLCEYIVKYVIYLDLNMLVGAATVGKSPDEYCKFLKKKKYHW